MATHTHENCGNGNSMEDWSVFEVLCGQKHAEGCCNELAANHCNIDVATTLRGELGALTYKNDRLQKELCDVKGQLVAKETECENLRTQTARQTALIGSLHKRLEAAEKREHLAKSRCDSTVQTIKQEKRTTDERLRQMSLKVQDLESCVSKEQQLKEQAESQHYNFLKCLAKTLNVGDCHTIEHLTAECVMESAKALVNELERARAKLQSTCFTLDSCESELMNVKSLTNVEKQRLHAALDNAKSHCKELETLCKQHEHELQIRQERLSEAEVCSDQLKDELRGMESRCFRIQSKLDRVQNERLQFLRSIATELQITEPCETLIKDKICEINNDNKLMHTQIKTLREQLVAEHEKFKETQKSSQCRLRSEEAQKCELEERLEKCQAEIHELRQEHLGLSEYLKRLSNVLNCNNCYSSMDIHAIAASLLDQVEHLVMYCDSLGLQYTSQPLLHGHAKECLDHQHTPNHRKLRRERSCHDMPLKESASVYNLQRRLRILREQIQKRDLQLELMKRKLSMVEDGAKGVCLLQAERDEAVCRAKKACKHVDRLNAQLVDMKTQMADVRAQLAEAIEYKLTALERARKIDELAAQNCQLAEEKSRILKQLDMTKERLKSLDDCSEKQRSRDEALINSLRKDIKRLESQLAEANCKLAHLQTFRTSVAQTLHLRDMPETDLLHRLQVLCSAHREFQFLTKRIEEETSPCPRYDSDDTPQQTAHCHSPTTHTELTPVDNNSHCQRKHNTMRHGSAGGGVGGGNKHNCHLPNEKRTCMNGSRHRHCAHGKNHHDLCENDKAF